MMRLRLQVDATAYASASTRRPALAPWICIAAGSLLRLAWPNDFEWKYDEQWMFHTAQRVVLLDLPWPWIGMPSGAGLQNPGASTWPFIGFAHVTHDPATMTLFVMVANVIALWGFAFWVHRAWVRHDRSIGMWGVALFAVSPLPVLLSRKIWAQNLLPVLLVPWLWGHTKREGFTAAFAWGAAGALLGQVHMSGFFAAAALALMTLVLDRRRTHWVGWLLGSGIAALPLVPWLSFLLSPRAPAGTMEHGLSLAFFSDAFLNGAGLHLRYTLGEHFVSFLEGPTVFGTQTLLVLAAHSVLAVLTIACIVLAVRDRHWLALPRDFRLYAATIALCGIAMHALGVVVYPHYLIVFSPLLHVFVAWLLVQRKWFPWTGCALQLFVTTAFLWFIHVNGGAPRGDYGVAYGVQTPAQRAFKARR